MKIVIALLLLGLSNFAFAGPGDGGGGHPPPKMRAVIVAKCCGDSGGGWIETVSYKADASQLSAMVPNCCGDGGGGSPWGKVIKLSYCVADGPGDKALAAETVLAAGKTVNQQLGQLGIGERVAVQQTVWCTGSEDFAIAPVNPGEEEAALRWSIQTISRKASERSSKIPSDI